jgi:hypothetical protein
VSAIISKVPSKYMDLALELVEEQFKFTELGYTGQKKARVEPTAGAAVEDYTSDAEEERQVVERKLSQHSADLAAERTKQEEHLQYLQRVKDATIAQAEVDVEALQKLDAARQAVAQAEEYRKQAAAQAENDRKQAEDERIDARNDRDYQQVVRMAEVMSPADALKNEELKRKLKADDAADALRIEEARLKLQRDAKAAEDEKAAAEKAARQEAAKKAAAAERARKGAATRKAKRAAEQVKTMVVEYINGTFAKRKAMEPMLYNALRDAGAYADDDARREFIASILREEPRAAQVPSVDTSSSSFGTERGVYRLDVDGAPYILYVGQSEDIEARLISHQEAKGDLSKCMGAAESFQRVALIGKERFNSLRAWEKHETLVNMYTYGIDNVRGARYCCRVHSDAQRKAIVDEVAELYDLCYKCGGGSHFARDCRASHYVPWAGGGRIL